MIKRLPDCVRNLWGNGYDNYGILWDTRADLVKMHNDDSVEYETMDDEPAYIKQRAFVYDRDNIGKRLAYLKRKRTSFGNDKLCLYSGNDDEPIAKRQHTTMAEKQVADNPYAYYVALSSCDNERDDTKKQIVANLSYTMKLNISNVATVFGRFVNKTIKNKMDVKVGRSKKCAQKLKRIQQTIVMELKER